MKCTHCDVCGKIIRVDDGAKLCLPVIIGTENGESRHCWCVCDDCKADYVKRSARVLEEIRQKQKV